MANPLNGVFNAHTVRPHRFYLRYQHQPRTLWDSHLELLSAARLHLASRLYEHGGESMLATLLWWWAVKSLQQWAVEFVKYVNTSGSTLPLHRQIANELQQCSDYPPPPLRFEFTDIIGEPGTGKYHLAYNITNKHIFEQMKGRQFRFICTEIVEWERWKKTC